MLKIYYLDDYLYREDADLGSYMSESCRVPEDYRLEEKFGSSSEIADDLVSVAIELIGMSRSPQWHSRGGRKANIRRPIRAGDIIVIDGKNYIYTLTSGWELPGCRLRLKPLAKGILS